MKNNAKRLFVYFSQLLMPIFYKKKYLKGRWFEDNYKGWIWCWKAVLMQKFIGYNRHIPFPVSHRNNIGDYENLDFHIDDLNNFQNFGNYYQCFDAKIILGKGTYIAPNVGLITQNHDLKNLDHHIPGKNIIIGKKCWIGMNSVILPGVTLGDNTIVGAGSIVTKSFKEGNCVIVGNPAKIIRKLDK